MAAARFPARSKVRAHASFGWPVLSHAYDTPAKPPYNSTICIQFRESAGFGAWGGPGSGRLASKPPDGWPWYRLHGRSNRYILLSSCWVRESQGATI